MIGEGFRSLGGLEVGDASPGITNYTSDTSFRKNILFFEDWPSRPAFMQKTIVFLKFFRCFLSHNGLQKTIVFRW